MSRYSLIILVQQTTGGETTGLVQQAKNTGGQLGELAGNVLENVTTFFGNILAYLVSVEFIGNLIATAVVVGLAILFCKLSMLLNLRLPGSGGEYSATSPKWSTKSLWSSGTLPLSARRK